MIIRDNFTEQLTPHQIDFGHLSENPSGWEERYERKNIKTHRNQGKVCMTIDYIVIAHPLLANTNCLFDFLLAKFAFCLYILHIR